jgi:shikimate kinase
MKAPTGETCPNDELSRLLERREPLLLGIADIVIDATRSPDEIVDQIVDEAEQQA